MEGAAIHEGCAAATARRASPPARFQGRLLHAAAACLALPAGVAGKRVAAEGVASGVGLGHLDRALPGPSTRPPVVPEISARP